MILSSGISMLEVMGIMFRGCEIKRAKDGVPTGIDVRVDFDKVTQASPDSASLEFTYVVDYKPALASLRISGEAVCRDSPDNIKRLLSEFKKKKEVPADLATVAVNMINANAGMNSIFILRPFNMLPPFMPPMLVQEGPKAAAPAKATPKKK